MTPLFFLRLRKLQAALRFPLTAKALIRHRVLGAFEHKHVLQLAPFSVIVDVGANRGQFSLAARALNPQAQLFAFEPLDAPAALYAMVMLGDSLTVLHKTAIADRTGTDTMHVSMKNDSSSLLPIGKRQVALFPDSVEVGKCVVTTKRLSEALAQNSIMSPSLLKIDVQGFELDVLKGSSDLLEKFDFVYVECSFVELYDGQAVASDVIGFLAGIGFHLRGIYNQFFSKEGEPIQADFLFNKIVH